MRSDNPEHKALFTIPEPSYGTAVATTKPLPPQRVITGHKQTDAYLWVLEVIRTNEPAHLPAAEEALAKLKITPKQAQECYSQYLMKSGVAPFQIVFGTMSMDNPADAIKAAKFAIKEASSVRALFGSYQAALDDCEAEKIIKTSQYFTDDCWGMTQQEIDDGIKGHLRLFEINDQRREHAKGYVDVMPAPFTLADVVREIDYWNWLFSIRNSACHELEYEYGYSDHPHYVYDRESYLETLLATLKPNSRTEATEVCKWVLGSEGLMDRGELTEAIILNLVGEIEA